MFRDAAQRGVRDDENFARDCSRSSYETPPAAEAHALPSGGSWSNEPNTYALFTCSMTKKIDRAVHDDEQSGIFVAL
nr:hypothetical protein [Bradyrhizobium tropiciagri]